MVNITADLCETAFTSDAVDERLSDGNEGSPPDRAPEGNLEAGGEIDLAALAAAMLGFTKCRKTDRIRTSKT